MKSEKWKVKNEKCKKNYSLFTIHSSLNLIGLLRRFIFVPPPTLAHALAVLGLPTLENSTLFFSIDSWIFIGKLKKNKELFCQRSKAQNCPQAILHNASYIIVQEKMIFLLFFIGIFSFTIIALCKIAARPTLPTLAQSPQGLCSFFYKKSLLPVIARNEATCSKAFLIKKSSFHSDRIIQKVVF